MPDAFLLEKRNSLVLKGVGILLMLTHHLFYSEWSQAYYNDITIHGVGLVNQIGVFSKLCVSIFVFVSGYGLAVSTPIGLKLKDFYWRRFKKLYLNYWFIWLLFVPIGVFVFGRTFADAYGEHATIKGVLDFLGLLKMFGVDSYNPTWWFYNCIIVLYLLFPLLNRYLWRNWFIVTSVGLTLILFYFVPGINVISGYLFTFIVGMLMSRMPLQWLRATKWWHVLIALVLLSAWRMTQASQKHIVDTCICAGMAIFLYVAPVKGWIGKIFEALGKHSMNMFLMHSFFFYFWFSKYIYITRSPLLILLSLTLICYLCSVFIERIKASIGFNRLLG